MIESTEAEQLAAKHVADYVNACECRDLYDLSKVLMKLLSVTGQAILATQGQDRAVAIVTATANHLAKLEFSEPYQMERAH